MYAKENGSEMKPLMSVREVATYLSVTPRTVYRFLKGGDLPGFRIGGQWRFKTALIEEWMRKERPLYQRVG
jgi:excisionase family DNA binding protein